MDDPKAKGLLVLILNIVLPGMGGITYSAWFRQDKRIMRRAVIQLSLFWASVIMASCNKYLYFMLVVAFGVWIWAIVDGVELYRSLVEKP